MGRNEVQTLVGFCGKQLGDQLICLLRSLAAITIHERLRSYETSRESYIQLSRVGLAPQFDRCPLGLTIAEFILFIHEYGTDCVGEFSFKLGVAREMNPTKHLDGRQPGCQYVGIDSAVGRRKR